MTLAPGTILASRYRVLGVVGRGGVGTVSRAQDLLLGGTVAVELLSGDVAARPQRIRRVRRMVRLARRVSHPHVRRIHEYVEDGAVRFVTMEMVEGSSLRRLLRRDGPFAPGLALDVAVQVAEGLSAIHAAGIAHRDLTPRNVIRDERGRVTISGFRRARRLKTPAAGPSTSRPLYACPEEVRGEPVDHRSDVYGLGILLYEMLTGRPPFRGVTPSVTLYQQMYEAPPLGGEAGRRVPFGLVPVLQKALAKRPEDRHQSAEDMAAALRAVRQAGEGVAFEPGSLPWPLAAHTLEAASPRLGWRGGSMVLAASVAVLAVALGTWLAVRGGIQAGPQPTGTVAEPASAEPTPFEVRTIPQEAASTSEAWPVPDRGTAATSETAAPGSPRRGPERRQRPDKVEGTRRTTMPAGSLPAPAREDAEHAAPAPERLTEPPIVPAVLEPQAEARPRDDADAATEDTGRLQVGVRPWATIAIDGRMVGESPVAPLSLAPGVHTARFEHPDFKPLVRKVTVRRGETTRLMVDLDQDAIPR
jgi:hypothetical protein